MPANTDELQAAIDAAAAQAEVTVGVEASAIVIIENVGAQIIAAVAADNAIDQANTDRLTEIVKQVTAKNVESSGKLSAAILANQPPV